MQGFNMGRYVPPDLEGVVSFNRASGKGHALGSRASKLSTEGILTVRFECPFAIWCTNCNPEQIIGQGVRFNAEKKKVGAYYSTPIWRFRFKHTLCGGWIEVRTDPKNAEYVVTEGGRRREYGGDMDEEGAEVRFDGVKPASEEEKQRLERDGAFVAMEKKVADKTLADAQTRRLDELFQASERDWADPYEMSRKLRADFRVGRRQRQDDERTGEALKDKFGLEVEMLAELPEDGDRVKYIDFGHRDEASSSSKPMFVTVRETLPSRSKPTLKLDQKDILQEQLRTNTRVATDPFLNGESPWQPRIKRKRDEVDAHEQRETRDNEDKEEQRKIPKVGGMALVGYDSDSS